MIQSQLQNKVRNFYETKIKAKFIFCDIMKSKIRFISILRKHSKFFHNKAKIHSKFNQSNQPTLSTPISANQKNHQSHNPTNQNNKNQLTLGLEHDTAINQFINSKTIRTKSKKAALTKTRTHHLTSNTHSSARRSAAYTTHACKSPTRAPRSSQNLTALACSHASLNH
jgi:hypothetical protein